jgi:DNA-binding GntR family transcriptional regulator
MSEDAAATVAALWRATEAEARALGQRARVLEAAVARAIQHPPSPAQVARLEALLRAQREALEATQARTIEIIATLQQDPS